MASVDCWLHVSHRLSVLRDLGRKSLDGPSWLQPHQSSKSLCSENGVGKVSDNLMGRVNPQSKACPQKSDRLVKPKLGRALRTVPNSIALTCDVTSRTSVEKAVDRTLDEFGGLEVVVASSSTFPSRGSD